ncbi:hypothetical protein [Loktanella sp. S4079]|uniref:hypothetical protein n=1 Tax=Loktanella sp. S4079 TaxID=579483 RepID=UPI0005FA6147|nr:hypothetical protein [Loktanella sp. S4079]KJZ18642.1 hypothetical protein TW80_14700 [Loktanella sp. S4079]
MTADDWFLEHNETPNPTAAKGHVVITQIARKSPAAALALEAGDALVSVNGTPAAKADIPAILLANKQVTYVFHRHRAGTMVRVKTAALPMGVRTEPSSDDIVARYRTQTLDQFEDAMTLWERGDHDHLRKICDGTAATKIFRKFSHTTNDNDLVTFVRAVCDIEAGDQEVFRGILTLRNEMGNGTNGSVARLADFYAARYRWQAGEEDACRNILIPLMHEGGWDSPRMTAFAKEVGIKQSENYSRLGKQYNYLLDAMALEVVAGGDWVANVTAWAKALPPDKVMPVCLMLTFRGNGPYNMGLTAFRTMYPFIKDRVERFVVITSVPDRGNDPKEWYLAEDAAIAEGLPLVVLADPSAFFADANVSAAPEYIALSHENLVVWDDSLHDDYAYWEMVADIGAD